MSLLFPVKNYIINSPKSKDENLRLLRDTFLGQKAYEIDSIFGKNAVNYNCEIDNDELRLTRSMGVSFRLPVYPTANISVHAINDESIIKIDIRLSIYWRIFICFIYLLIFVLVVFSLFQKNEISEKAFLILKSFGSVLVLNVVVYFYHYTESNNIRLIFENNIGDVLEDR